MKSIFKKSLALVLENRIRTILLCVFLFVIAIDQYFESYYGGTFVFHKIEEIKKRDTGIVLGAAVWKNKPSPILADRLLTAVHLYKNKKIAKILVSGDHDSKYYNEAKVMKLYLIKKGVNKKDIYVDNAGFSTLESMSRAKTVFKIKELVIISQHYHLPRAVFFARHLGINAIGFSSDRRPYQDKYYNRLRELFARITAWLKIYL